jgi:hypothetical protein
LAWFKKLPKSVLVEVTLYENDAGQKAYRISQVSGILFARQLAPPLLLFAVSAVLMFRKLKPLRGHEDSGARKESSVSPTIRI